MGSFSIWHWLIVLVIVMVIFGTKKLGNMGSDLGKAVKGFKDGVKGEEEKAANDPAATVTPVTPVNPVTPVQSTIDVQAREKDRTGL